MRVLIYGAGSERGQWYASYHINRGDAVTGVDSLVDPVAKAWYDGGGALWKFACWKSMRFAQYIGYIGLRDVHWDVAYVLAPEDSFMAWATGRVGRVIYEPLAGTEPQVVTLLASLS